MCPFSVAHCRIALVRAGAVVLPADLRRAPAGFVALAFRAVVLVDARAARASRDCAFLAAVM
ncbi:hypothetical protein AWB99_21890 [Mycolicibacterium confluentis]|nr:hypothetical protein AWB99_21890 [Mycolicibacterium confluentis]